MRRIWIPYRMYRAFPVVAMLSGSFFYVFMQSVFGIGLCALLFVYGLVVCGLRAGW